MNHHAKTFIIPLPHNPPQYSLHSVKIGLNKVKVKSASNLVLVDTYVPGPLSFESLEPPEGPPPSKSPPSAMPVAEIEVNQNYLKLW